MHHLRLSGRKILFEQFRQRYYTIIALCAKALNKAVLLSNIVAGSESLVFVPLTEIPFTCPPNPSKPTGGKDEERGGKQGVGGDTKKKKKKREKSGEREN